MSASVLSPPSLPDGTELLGFPVSISEIETKLSQFFTPASDEEPVSDDTGSTRASILNLALFSENTDQLTEDAHAIEEVTLEAACRSLLIHIDTDQPQPSAHAWVQAHCKMSDGGKKTVCSEHISFFLTGSSPGRVRNLVFGHLDSDLPLVFWWRGEFSSAFEDRLYSRFDKLIFDSDSWADPIEQFDRLIEAAESPVSHFSMHDLAYTRLNAYRLSISNAFDCPAFIQRLPHIEGMKIRYPKGHQMMAHYLAGWVATRLQSELQTTQSQSHRYVFTSPLLDADHFAIELEEVSDGEFATAIKVGDSIIELSRCPSSDYLRTRLMLEDGKVESEDWVPTRSDRDPALVTQILERGGRNRTMCSLLEMVRGMLRV